MPAELTAKLTQSFANSVMATGKKQRFPDHKVTGLVLRVAPGGTKTWVIRYRGLDGTSREMKIGAVDKMPLEIARRKARVELANVPSGEDPLQNRENAKREAVLNKNQTIEAVIGRYRSSSAYLSKRATTQSTYDNSFDRHIIPRIGKRSVKGVRRGEVSELLDNLLTERSGGVSNQARSALSVVMSFAVEHDIIDFNPVQGIKAKHRTEVRKRLLSEDELKGLWEALALGEGLSPPLVDMIRLLMLLPARANEIAGMAWSELNLDDALWQIPASRMKGHEDHELPLGDEALSILQRLRADATTPWVFPNKAKNDAMNRQRPSRACNRLSKMQGWSSFGPHDLRRTIATNLAGLGFEHATVERLLGHKVGAGRAIVNYDHHDYRDRKKMAIDAWEGRLMQIVRGTAQEDNVRVLNQVRG